MIPSLQSLLLPRRAPWARVPSATLNNSASFGIGSAPATWNAGNLGAFVPAGAKILVCFIAAEIAGSFPNATAVTDSIGNVYSKDLSTTYVTGTVGCEMSVWSAVSKGGTPNSITPAITWINNTNFSGVGLAAVAYSGLSTLAGTAGIDISAITNYGGSVKSTTADSGVTTAASKYGNELKVGFYADAGENTTLTAGTVDTAYSAFVTRQSDGNAQLMIEDADSGPLAKTAQAQATSSGAAAWAMAVVVYKRAGVTL